jgi:hypothetical protein
MDVNSALYRDSVKTFLTSHIFHESSSRQFEFLKIWDSFHSFRYTTSVNNTNNTGVNNTSVKLNTGVKLTTSILP